ncbi:hypothetical protein L249_4467 [Ophiocordyceps polyrhachis-furcata BCC 54312]|uniref:Uncharacterized protein n=1 Tax=Ophiocordyceps polyrhachis-furcata BCC 54312 TaxID=1330021 RepID=A0A367L878_9HYPO|nr:hypothetical protein L249_4467 [Ophiocordyceps polyrhachis-furcata BCC 54312]
MTTCKSRNKGEREFSQGSCRSSAKDDERHDKKLYGYHHTGILYEFTYKLQQLLLPGGAALKLTRSRHRLLLVRLPKTHEKLSNLTSRAGFFGFDGGNDASTWASNGEGLLIFFCRETMAEARVPSSVTRCTQTSK